MALDILKKVYYFLLDFLQTILLIAAGVLVIYVFLFRPFQVSGSSMYPNFHDGEHIITNLIGLRVSNLKLGDVVVFSAPPDPEKDFIKRVIGVPGDRISLKGGYVYLNGGKLDESPYLSSAVKTYPGSFLREGEEITVPLDEYFVLGDNRPESSDSREWGFVPKKNVVGLSFLIYLPLNEIAIVKNPYQK